MKRVASNTVPTYTYPYTYQIDSMAHTLGPKQEEVRATVRDLDLAQERFSQSLGRGAQLMLGTDQGFLDTSPAILGQLASTD